MNEIRKYFNVEEITIGHGGDSSVGLPCEYTLSTTMKCRNVQTMLMNIQTVFTK